MKKKILKINIIGSRFHKLALKTLYVTKTLNIFDELHINIDKLLKSAKRAIFFRIIKR